MHPNLHPKLKKIEEFLGEGFDVSAIDSNHGRIDVALTKDDMTVTMTLTREDAATILWGGPTPPSHLVTLPLR